MSEDIDIKKLVKNAVNLSAEQQKLLSLILKEFSYFLPFAFNAGGDWGSFNIITKHDLVKVLCAEKWEVSFLAASLDEYAYFISIEFEPHIQKIKIPACVMVYVDGLVNLSIISKYIFHMRNCLTSTRRYIIEKQTTNGKDYCVMRIIR